MSTVNDYLAVGGDFLDVTLANLGRVKARDTLQLEDENETELRLIGSSPLIRTTSKGGVEVYATDLYDGRVAWHPVTGRFRVLERGPNWTDRDLFRMTR